MIPAGMSPSLILQAHFNFCHLFERIIRSWGAVDVRHLGDILGEPTGLPVERSVALSGTLTGVLNFRTTAEFLEWLRRQRTGTFLGQYPVEDILDELVSLFCLYLFHDYWNPSNFQVGPIHPVPSRPQDWPAGLPQVACTLLVEGQPVEIRLWVRN
jgi:hypothetical protein